MLSLCFFNFSVGVGDFVTGLSQILSLFSLYIDDLHAHLEHNTRPVNIRVYVYVYKIRATKSYNLLVI